jgi:hypothetical protein
MAQETNLQESEAQRIAIRLEWEPAVDIPTTYANHLHISHAAGNEFFLVFGELGPQPDLDPQSPPESLGITPVAKIAVSPANMVRFAEVIQENVDRFKEKPTARTEEGE